MKIYVITAGDYEDYRIYGATTDEMTAEEMRLKVSAYTHDDAEIKVCDDGKFADEEIGKIFPCEYWNVTIRPDRAPYATKYMDSAGIPVSTRELLYTSRWRWQEDSKAGYRREGYKVYTVEHILAEDEEHAVKIAMDEMAKCKAEKEKERARSTQTYCAVIFKPDEEPKIITYDGMAGKDPEVHVSSVMEEANSAFKKIYMVRDITATDKEQALAFAKIELDRFILHECGR